MPWEGHEPLEHTTKKNQKSCVRSVQDELYEVIFECAATLASFRGVNSLECIHESIY